MKIKYLGHSCFQLTSRQGTVVITDPYTRVGYELPDGLKASVVTTSHSHFDHNYTEKIECSRVINELGVYQIDDVRISGILSDHDDKNGALRGKNIIYKYEMDNLTVCHFGDLGEEVSPLLLEKIGRIDVLLIPVGGKYTIDDQQAKVYVDAIAPKVIIPMHFKPSDGQLDILGVEPFLAQFSRDIIQRRGANALEIQAGSLLDATCVIYLER